MAGLQLRPIAVALLAASPILLTVGCGKGDYDKLVKTRIEQLNNPHKHGILVWKEIESQLAYQGKMPKGEETVDLKEADGVTTEIRDTVFGSRRYQLVFSEFAENTEASVVAEQVEQQYKGQGYTDFLPEEGEEGSGHPPVAAPGSVKSLNLVNEQGVRARVEVVQLGQRGVATLAVIAADLTEADCSEFFGSVKKKFVARRRR